jgi:hypothetical protein
MCPSESNLSQWNSLGTWGKVRNRVEQMKNNTKSKTRQIQGEAMMNFYGIKLGSGSAATSGGVPNVGFVRIQGGPSASYLNMSQLVVYDEQGRNVSVRRPTQSSGSPYGPPGSGTRGASEEMANDGDERPRPHPYEFHGKGSNDFWQVKLDGPTTVTSVVVYNRSDCCGDRMGYGFVIKLINPSGAVLLTIDVLNDRQVQRIMTPGGVFSPRTAPVEKFQEMFESAGCTNKLTEGHLGWWRSLPEMSNIQGDMNAYGSLTKNCSGAKWQHEVCISGKCK